MASQPRCYTRLTLHSCVGDIRRNLGGSCASEQFGPPAAHDEYRANWPTDDGGVGVSYPLLEDMPGSHSGYLEHKATITSPHRLNT